MREILFLYPQIKIFMRQLFFVGCLAITACSKKPYASTNKQHQQQAKALSKVVAAAPTATAMDSIVASPYWVGTTNFNLRKPNLVIIHHTAQKSCEQTLKTFTLERTQVSAHYVICEDGTVYHMLNDYMRAWHAGAGKWGNNTDINSSSIGIELDNDGFEPFSDAQVNSLLLLLEALKKNYSIPTAGFIGHADIAPTRKNDPNVNFPWKLLSTKGFGLWQDEVLKDSLPQGFDAMHALRIIGYDVRDAEAAIKAFKRHFLQENNSGVLTDEDKKVLFNLMKKYL
jgi:N-acetylmuramoyl-L-alanine amidase